MVNVLVTGADGFIGSHLTEFLLKKQYNVTAMVNYNSFNSWGWLDHYERKMPDNLTILPGDIRDSLLVRKAIEGKDVVFHLAALIAIPFSYTAPEAYVDTNIKGTLNVLNSAKEERLKRLLITSTSEVYGTAKYVPIDENHPYQGQSPYAATKIGADRLAESYYKSFGVPLTIVRPFNTYGPRQSARAFIPTIISQLLDKKDSISLGNINSTRDLVYVKDTIEGFFRISNIEETIGKEINIATGKEYSIKFVLDTIIKKINPDVKIIIDPSRIRPENSEVERLCGSNNLLNKYTGWVPKVELEYGLDETIDWFKKPENLKKYKTHIYNK